MKAKPIHNHTWAETCEYYKPVRGSALNKDCGKCGSFSKKQNTCPFAKGKK